MSPDHYLTQLTVLCLSSIVDLRRRYIACLRVSLVCAVHDGRDTRDIRDTLWHRLSLIRNIGTTSSLKHLRSSCLILGPSCTFGINLDVDFVPPILNTRGDILIRNSDWSTVSHRDKGTPDPSAKWWTTSEVAAYLGVDKSAVSSYKKKGVMPAPDEIYGRTSVWSPKRIIEWHADRPRPGTGGRPSHKNVRQAESTKAQDDHTH